MKVNGRQEKTGNKGEIRIEGKRGRVKQPRTKPYSPPKKAAACYTAMQEIKAQEEPEELKRKETLFQKY